MNTLKTLGLSILAVFAPIKMIIISMIVLVLADMVTGVWAAHKRGESITSAALRRTISKLCIYLTVTMVGYLTETFLLAGSLPVTNIVAGIIGITELKSLAENSNEIVGGNLFTQFILMLGSKNDEKKD